MQELQLGMILTVFGASFLNDLAIAALSLMSFVFACGNKIVWRFGILMFFLSYLLVAFFLCS